MSYTYPQALSALESIANDFIKAMRPNDTAPVRLVCDPTAQTACVEWNPFAITVTMPVRPATSIMTQTEFEDWTAYMLHELGHPTHTDKAAWEASVKAGVSRMVNALEDVRMEQALIASGIVPNARAVLSRLVSRKIAEARANGWKPNARKEFGWTVCVLGRAANGYAIEASDLAWIKSQIKSGSTVETVLGWAMPALAACQDTADCVALAQRIMRVLRTPQGQQGQQGQQGEGQQGKGQQGKGQQGEGQQGKGQQGESESESEEASNEAGEAAGEGEGEGESEEASEKERMGEASDTAGDSNAGKGGKGHGDGTTDADEKPVTDDVEEHSLAPESEAMDRSQGVFAEKAVIDILRDSVIQSPPKSPVPTNRLNVQGQRLKDKAAKASKQRALLARALRANETDEREGGRKAGRLDRSALSRVCAGATNVFERRDISEGFDTDVCVLLDASGSMCGYNMASALEAGLVIAQAASSVGAACTVEIFNQTGYTRAGTLASRRAPNPAEYGALVSEATGGTPLSAHMARVAVNQAKRAPQKRRVLFVVTDGGCDYGPATVQRMATYLEQAHGTIMAHVSIGTPLRGSFKAEVCVPSGAALADIGLDHFVKVLRAL